MGEEILNDPLGQAALDHLKGKRQLEIQVQSNIVEDDVIPVDYLFRDFANMPTLEQKGLNHCQGKVLDLGGGVGSHSLELQRKGMDVTLLDVSYGCCQVARQRGVKEVINEDFYAYEPEVKYDTILLMMNGIGLAAAVDHLPTFFNKLKEYLAPKGQVILDSSDLRYLYIDEDSYCDLPDETYYGEVMYTMSYKDHKTSAFEWLFIDPALLALKAKENGFAFENLADGDHYDYLTRLTLIK
ncbi:bifunctional 2-polyprenyl-6-hydroxyphenol methylase/3-demethylubiquinol 3-O-methyltransferase UbiG [Carboxylicivirga sp. M1479]|uniref:class I SAM-dependent methyltransferase n=1 Tax=Carboxylicivirga sp. M1479 TaxID=2594476 RepID=UPI001178A9CF|nr:class I SAM-dependent methyltransferase [Carboxylicivirga sp. M1479]TRX65687.1 class I SAM-dependent methyltransferase [Carboxylicivirga sp. M1479]